MRPSPGWRRTTSSYSAAALAQRLLRAVALAAELMELGGDQVGVDAVGVEPDRLLRLRQRLVRPSRPRAAVRAISARISPERGSAFWALRYSASASSADAAEPGLLAQAEVVVGLGPLARTPRRAGARPPRREG